MKLRDGERLIAIIASAASYIVGTLRFISISLHGERSILDLMLAKIVLSLVLVPALIYLLVALGRRLDGAR